MNLERLNNHCLERVRDYQELRIGNQTVQTPYYINNVEAMFASLMQEAGVDNKEIQKVRTAYRERKVPYGWHRGKGTPEEIAEAALQISREVGLPLEKSDASTIQEFMKLYALGVDCSGFVYNVLSYAFEKEGQIDIFNKGLDWNNNQGVTTAGSFVFAGSASNVVNPQEMREQDLILIKGRRNNYAHIALLLREDDGLVVAQSSIAKAPSGVRTDSITPTKEGFVVGYDPQIGDRWETLCDNGKLEFRRLKVLSDIN